MTKDSAMRIFLPAAAVLLLFWAGSSFGAFHIPLNEWFDGGTLDPVVRLRMVRMAAAMVTGGALALSGMVLQCLLRNPLADPFTLGLSGGAGVGAVLAFMLGWRMVTVYAVPLSALAGALAVLLAVLRISRREQAGGDSLILSGVIAGTVCSSILMYLVSIAREQELSSITWWMLGDLQSADEVLLWPSAAYLLLALLILRFAAGHLNALSLGDEQAWNLGSDPAKLRTPLIVIASLLAASTVAMAGIIGFCGLVMPHIIRRIYGGDHRRITLPVFWWGGAFLMLCDLLSRIVNPAREIPVGVITSLIGGPLFLCLLRRGR